MTSERARVKGKKAELRGRIDRLREEYDCPRLPIEEARDRVLGRLAYLHERQEQGHEIVFDPSRARHIGDPRPEVAAQPPEEMLPQTGETE